MPGLEETTAFFRELRRTHDWLVLDGRLSLEVEEVAHIAAWAMHLVEGRTFDDPHQPAYDKDVNRQRAEIIEAMEEFGEPSAPWRQATLAILNADPDTLLLRWDQDLTLSQALTLAMFDIQQKVFTPGIGYYGDSKGTELDELALGRLCDVARPMRLVERCNDLHDTVAPQLLVLFHATAVSFDVLDDGSSTDGDGIAFDDSRGPDDDDNDPLGRAARVRHSLIERRKPGVVPYRRRGFRW